MFTEILQGFRSDREAHLVERHLKAFPMLRLDGPGDFALAAELYRRARRAGVTIRKTLDCLIAAPCVRTGAPILHADTDFDRLAECTPLRVYSLSDALGNASYAVPRCAPRWGAYSRVVPLAPLSSLLS